LADKLGTLEKGKLADVLVVEGNPLSNFENLKNLKLLVADRDIVRDRLAVSRSTNGSPPR
jgi:imidazolonepropionase-like amidohydrolase